MSPYQRIIIKSSVVNKDSSLSHLSELFWRLKENGEYIALVIFLLLKYCSSIYITQSTPQTNFMLQNDVHAEKTFDFANMLLPHYAIQ